MFSKGCQMNLIKRLKAKWRAVRNTQKAIKLKATCALYDHRDCSDVFCAADVKHIVIFRWDDKLGDCIMAGILINNLRLHRPDIKITVICRQTTKLWLDKVSFIDEYILLGKHNLRKILQPYKNKYDVFVDVSNGFSYKEIFIAKYLNTKHYLGFSADRFNIIDISIDSKQTHFYQRYINATKILTNKDCLNSEKPPVPHYNKELEFLDSLIIDKGYKNIVGINFFGSGKYRRFSFEKAASLMKYWLEKHPEDLLILLPTPGEEKFLTKIVNQLASPNLFLPTDKASLEMSLAIIDKADFTFTPDTAVVHMASALDKPVIGIYRENRMNYEEWKPLGMHSQTIFNREPICENDSVYVYEFGYEQLEEARTNILKAIK